MKIAVLLLAYNRFETMVNTLAINNKRAGIEFDLFALDNGSTDGRILSYLLQHRHCLYRFDNNIGIAAGFNKLLAEAYRQGYHFFQFIANDIIEPENWLIDRVHASVERHGMVSMAVEDNREPFVQQDVIGQFMITRDVVEKVGYLCEDYGLYGPIDLDYNARVRAAGFSTYYIPGRAHHIGDHGAAAPPEYGYDKAEMIAKSWPKLEANIARYLREPYVPYTIYENQFPGE